MSGQGLLIFLGLGVLVVLVLLVAVILIFKILYTPTEEEREYIKIENDAQRLLVLEAIRMMEKIRIEIQKIEKTIQKDKNVKKYAQRFTDEQARAGDFDQALVGSTHASQLMDRIRRKEDMISLFETKLKNLDEIYDIMDSQMAISQEDFELIYKVLNLAERNEAEIKNLLELIENFTSYVTAPKKEQKRYRKLKGYIDNHEMYKAKKFHLQVEIERMRKQGRTDDDIWPLLKLVNEIDFRLQHKKKK